MKKNLSIFLCLTLLLSPLSTEAFSLWRSKAEGTIVIHNRILAHVNGKTITVLDLVRKLDLLFYQRYPQYADSSIARKQFYDLGWKQVLEELIDQELLLAEAEQMKIEVSKGAIRKEMLKVFGPHVVANLQKIGMNYQDACQAIKNDLTIQQIMMMKVHAKAQRRMTPKAIQTAYDEYREKNPPVFSLAYRIISIRHRNEDEAIGIATNLVSRLKEGVSYQTCQDEHFSNTPNSSTMQVRFSALQEQEEQEIGESYRTILATLEPGECSNPILQKKRSSDGAVVRVFLLENRKEKEGSSLADKEPELRQKLMAVAVEEETIAYLTGLRRKYGLQQKQIYEKLPDDFVPFEIQ